MAQGFMKDFLVVQDELSDTDGDTRIRVEAIGDEDTLRVDVGDNISGYPAIPDVLLISAAQFTLDLGAADIAATAGAPIRFKAGDGNTTGDGGDITFEAGVSAGGSAGAVILPDQVAPSVTTNKLYAVAGNIFWNGLDLAAMAIGDVVKVGTPVDNEIMVWTGDGTAEGDTNLQWDGAILAVVGNITASNVSLVGYFLPNLATDAELNAIADAINTDVGKVQGAMVYNTTTDNPVYAVGNADGDVWNDGAGVLANTPV